jgi:hypothetical protein
MINIKSLRSSVPSEPWDVRVDRASVLGNPFHMRDESQRDAVCDAYAQWIAEQIPSNRVVCSELNRLIRIHKEYGQLNLYCWCSPKRCHAETIRALLQSKIK